MAYNRFTRPKTVPADIGGDSLTVQQFKDDCDIATIIRRHRATGEPLPVNPNGVYFNLLDTPSDLQSALELCRDVAAQMDSLPLPARQRFNCDPVAFVEFLSHEENREEAVRLGLIRSPAVSPASASPTTKSVEAQPPVSGSVTPSLT